MRISPSPLTPSFSERGHEVFDIRGTPDEGMDDAEIFELALENEAAFLTTDGDFFYTVPHHYPEHNGVVVITLPSPTERAFCKSLNGFWTTFQPRHWRGAFSASRIGRS
jgi:predicted nuclease of predicted toxin-antitoxin system